MPGAGRLNKRVTFQREVRIPDGGGGADRVWSDYFSCDGAYSPERGREKIEAGRLESSSAGILVVRSSSETRIVDEAYRVIIDGIAHQIRAIGNPDQHDRFLEFVVERGVAI
jgi:SPP1 family predicted phage head-tail adaptor